jgi:hypothetical protein
VFKDKSIELKLQLEITSEGLFTFYGLLQLKFRIFSSYENKVSFGRNAAEIVKARKMFVQSKNIHT